MAAIAKVESYMTKARRRWRGRYFHPDHSWCERGQRLGHCKGHTNGLGGFDTKNEALIAAQERQYKAKKGAPLVNASEDTTLAVVFALWHSSGPSGIKSPKTLTWYGDLWRALTNKNPPVDQIAVTDITPLHVSSWLGALREEELAQTTLQGYTQLIRHILRYAVNPLGLQLQVDPDNIDTPTSTQDDPGERPRLTEDQVWALAAMIDKRYRTLVLMGAYTGLRFGELSGLRPKYLDRSTEPYIIDVQWQWDARHTKFRRPKHRKTRQVPVTPELTKIVHKQLLQYSPTENQHRLIFAVQSGAPILPSNFRNRIWYPAVKRARLPRVSPHSLRATFVDIMIDRSIPYDIVRDMCGHEDISITMNVYKGKATTIKMSDAVMAASEHALNDVKALQQAVNAEAGVMHATLHSDGRLDFEGLHPDWTPDGDVIPLPVN